MCNHIDTQLFMSLSIVTPDGPIFGREAIEKHYTEWFQEVHLSNQISQADEYSPHSIGEILVREGDDWKIRMLT